MSVAACLRGRLGGFIFLYSYGGLQPARTGLPCCFISECVQVIMMAKPVLCFQLRVHLAGSEPEIWRRLLVPAEATLYDLHWILQAAFGWGACHLYQFGMENGGAAGRVYPDFEDFDFDDPEDCERRAMETAPKLRDVLPVGERMIYTYDMGDDWEHVILCEALIIKPPRLRLPACTDGAMNHALEDVGGIWGYQEIVDVIANQHQPDYQQAVADLQESFGKRILKYDAAAFDPKKIKFPRA